MATVAVAVEKCFVTGDRKRVTGTITLTGNYTALGEVVTPAMLGLEIQLDHLDIGVAKTTGGMFPTDWDKANNKVRLFSPVDATPAVNEQGPELAAAAIPGGPAVLRFDATGKGSQPSTSL